MAKIDPIKQRVLDLCGTTDKEIVLSKLRAVKEEKVRRLKHKKYRYFVPNGKGEEFIRQVGSGENFIILFSAANGVGKTTTSANIVAHILWGKDSENPYFDLPLFKNFPYPKRGRIVSDPTNIEKNLIPTLKEWFPEGRYTTSKAGKHYDSIWKTDTGFEFDIMSYEQDVKEFEAATLGWCIEENERVLLEDGRWLPIKNINVGDIILNTNNNYRKKKCRVIAKFDRGIKETVRVKVRGGQTIICTPDHKIWCSNKDKWIEAGKLKKGDRLYSPSFPLNLSNTFDKDLAFLIGVWIGDGWFNKSVFVACADDILLAEIEKRVEKISHKNRYDYRIICKKLRNYLISSGLSKKKSRTKFIPDIFFKEDRATIELLKGLYSTDGWFSDNKIGYGTTSKRLAEDLVLLLKNRGIKAGIYNKKRQKENWSDQYFVLISQKDSIIKFCELVDVPNKKKALTKVLMEAKRRKGKTLGGERKKRDTRRTVLSVENFGKKRVYDISVEGEHSFICNGIRVSNCWFDEPPTEPIFKATVARMRKGGIIFISETPLYAAWLYDHIIANPDKDLLAKGQRVYVEADVESACKQHGIRGHLEHSHIEKMIAEYTEDEKQARVYGKFQHLVGLRFKAFSRNVHVIRPFEVDPRRFCVYHALDTHPRVNDAGTWIAVDERGRKFVVDELWEKCVGGTEELAQRIKKKNEQYRIERQLLEPSAFIEDQHTEQSLAAKLAHYGLSYVEATKMRAIADKRIEDALAYQKINVGDGEEYIKYPELYIFDTCPRTIYEFEHLRWDEWQGKIAEKKDAKEKTIDKDDHMIENIGRILIQEPQFYPMPQAGGSGIADDPDYDPFQKTQ